MNGRSRIVKSRAIERKTTSSASRTETPAIPGLRTLAFIDGEFVPSVSGATYPVRNPATGLILSQVTACNAVDVDRAVMAARRAFEDGRWSRKSPKERKLVLQRFADLIDSHLEELALLETLNVGKPLNDSRSLDVPKAAYMIRWYAEATDKLYGDVAPTAGHALAFVTQEPLGVIGAVIPWNFPLYLAAYKLGPALATGNSVVLKPADQTPLTALRIAELAREAGLPDGVLNVVPGLGTTTGAALGLHPEVDCIAFTGSPAVARHFMRYSADSNLKRVQIEGGGKSPHIVLRDAEDLERIAHEATWGIFYNQGQVCSAGSRLIVEEPLVEELVSRIVKLAAEIRVGDPLDPATQLGALVDARQCERVGDRVRAGINEGARLAFGGRQLLKATGGWFFEPTVFVDVQNSMSIAREEIFGPVLSVISCSDADHAVRIANDSAYGLGAAVWSQNINRALNAARSLRAGIVWVNNYDAGDLTVPWGGFKMSGTGRDKSLEAINEYTASKATWIELRQ
jgi:acyl-CoA reductase-like NAD-dependent aldehyde dehydrogenase